MIVGRAIAIVLGVALVSTNATAERLPPAGSRATGITEDVIPVPNNIYGVTKVARESRE